MPHSSPYPYKKTSSPVEDYQEDCEPDEFYCDASLSGRKRPFYYPSIACQEVCIWEGEIKSVSSIFHIRKMLQIVENYFLKN
jgi:hypothetical protein